ncbi:MAG: LodA/GoxA family CTQ-dependent oxidase [Alphaproteobacteria bacterium]
MTATFRIHPAIGIARLGNSPTSFYIAPEQAGVFPIDCDQDGNPIVKDGKEVPISKFKDTDGRIRRQAARFRVFIYDDSGEGREVEIGDTFESIEQATGQVLKLRIDDIRWNVYLANKKSSWYQFQQTAGEHGYAANHPLRNADITDSDIRQQLIIDPGPRSVSFTTATSRRASFDASHGLATFPPPLKPNSITTLGDLVCTQQDKHNRLLVLGGFGNSGSMIDGFGNPKIEAYANNDGWFDDTSDGPVKASLVCTLISTDGAPAPPDSLPVPIAVDDAAWVLVGYPRYAPEFSDIVTMDELVFDVAVRTFAYVPYMFGVAPFNGSVPSTPQELNLWRAQARWNADYRPYFYRDIWPILQRPLNFQYFMANDPMFGGNPHDTGPRGNFDQAQVSIPPYDGEDPTQRAQRRAKRQFIYSVLRKAGQENELLVTPYAGDSNYRLYRMPLLCGDNPLSNTAPSKFLRLTDTMLFLLAQWAEGRFINEQREDIATLPQPPGAGAVLDRGALAGGLGGSFCPGGEASWIMRNPAVYASAYRINPASAEQSALSLPPGNIAGGAGPGDLTKYSAVPWQSDFNECTTQHIDFTYEGWNNINPASTGDPVKRSAQLTYWWPVHRPVNVLNNGPWSPTPQNNAGDLQMVTMWSKLGFVVSTTDPNNPVTIVEAGTTGA